MIALTGTTGALGSRVARLLTSAGRDHRLLVRDPGRVAAHQGVEVAEVAGYADSAVRSVRTDRLRHPAAGERARVGQIARGEVAAVADTVERVTGRAPPCFADYLRANPSSWSHLRSPS